MRPWHLGVAVAGVILAALLWLLHAVDAQRPKGSDTAQIRRVIVACAKAAMRRDSAAVNRHISNDYKDGLGLTADQARLQVGRVLGGAREVQVYIPLESEVIAIEPDRKHASARFDLQFRAVGSQPGADVSFRGALSVRFQKEPVRYFAIFPGEEWRIIAAEGYTPAFLE